MITLFMYIDLSIPGGRHVSIAVWTGALGLLLERRNPRGSLDNGAKDVGGVAGRGAGGGLGGRGHGHLQQRQHASLRISVRYGVNKWWCLQGVPSARGLGFG